MLISKCAYLFCQHEIWNPLGKQLLSVGVWSEGDSVQLVYKNRIWDIGKLKLLDSNFGRQKKQNGRETIVIDKNLKEMTVGRLKS